METNQTALTEKWRLILMRAHNSYTFRYAVIGLLSFAVNFSVVLTLTELVHFPPEVSFFCALVTVFFVNFLMLRFYLRWAANTPWRQHLLMYLAANIGIRLTEQIFFLILYRGFGLDYKIVTVSVVAISFTIKYFFFKRGSDIELP